MSPGSTGAQPAHPPTRHAGRLGVRHWPVVAAAGSLLVRRGAEAHLRRPPPPHRRRRGRRPHFALQGCAYVLNGQVPAGEPPGVQPRLRSFAGPDRRPGRSPTSRPTAAPAWSMASPSQWRQALCGPGLRSRPVATIPVDRSMLVADPVLWTTGSGAHWLAIFVACGGQDLYWSASTRSAARTDAATGGDRSIAMLEAAAPYTADRARPRPSRSRSRPSARSSGTIRR